LAVSLAILALATGIAAPGGQALPPPPARPPARWHFTFRKGLELSVLFWRAPEGDDTRVLLAAGGRRFAFVSRQDLTGRDSTETVALLEGTVPVMLERRLILSGFSAVEGCEAVRTPDACVLLAGPKGRLSAPFSVFSGKEAATTREKAAALVPETLRAALFDLAPVLPMLTEFGSYAKDFLGLIWPERFHGKQVPTRGKRVASCDFDSGFGYPCDAAEREKEMKRFGASPGS
jgi:hypothetical protein